jgi:hypothetical protein
MGEHDKAESSRDWSTTHFDGLDACFQHESPWTGRLTAVFRNFDRHATTVTMVVAGMIALVLVADVQRPAIPTLGILVALGLGVMRARSTRAPLRTRTKKTHGKAKSGGTRQVEPGGDILSTGPPGAASGGRRVRVAY